MPDNSSSGGNGSGNFFDSDLEAFITIAVTIAVVAYDVVSLTQHGAGPKPEAALYPLKQSVPPCSYLVGDYSRPQLAFVFYEARDNLYAAVYAVNDGRVDSYAAFYVNDDTVSLSGDPSDGSGSSDGFVTAVLNGYDDGRYVDERMRINYRLGLATETVYDRMTEFFSDTVDSTWRGDGTASLMVHHFTPTDLKFFRQAFPSGRPNESVVARGVCYDWRQDTTAGGSGAQRRDDETTWSWSANPVVWLVHLEWFRWGRDWDRCIAPVLSTLTDEADYCDGAVSLHAGGTENRYRCAGWFNSETARSDVRQKLLDTMDGFYTTDGQGRLIIKAGRYDAPAFTITADHIEGFTWTRGIPAENVVNELSISFTSPAHDYTSQECDPWIVGDGGKVDSLALPWVPSFTQARRLAKRRMARLNPVRQGQIRTGPIGLNGLGDRYIGVQNPRRDSMADVVCEVVNCEFDPMSGGFVFDVITADPDIDDWDPATEEGAPVPVQTRPPSS